MADPFQGEGPWSVTAETGRAIRRNRTVELVFNLMADAHAENYLYIRMSSEGLKRFADSLDAAVERSETA